MTGRKAHKPEGPKTLGSYKYLGITMPKVITANDKCPICDDTASKRRIRNPCICEIHRAYT